MKKILLAVVAAVAVLGGSAYWFGAYDVSATNQHLKPTFFFLDLATRRSIAMRAKHIEAPPLDDPALIARGATHFRVHCVQCHGAPGVAPEPFALGLTPAAKNLVYTARIATSAELFWTIKHGLKMTGMPAWAFRMTDEEIWSVVAFMHKLTTLTPDEYRDFATRPVSAASSPTLQTDAARGKLAVQQYACPTCHEIPGIVGANSPVGPPLTGIGNRALIAGMLPNTPESMMRWLRAPQSINPKSAMPDLGVTEHHAADMAAYLATLKSH
ncbi:MAG TPA: c-type cytochrome [Casimicrobiaceae bacterium]|nr:c-type cytochrome [Casimicrobiaceae bacterium]